MTNETLSLAASPVRFVLAFEDRVLLCCPVCGSRNVHPQSVEVEQGRTRVRVDGDRVATLPTDRHLHRRGSEIALRFWCEGWHAFEYRLDFHKGELWVELRTATRTDADSDREELWRN